jgi:chromosome segregation ATPase
MDDLKDLIAKKTDIDRRKERLLGKLESAKSTLSQIDARLKELGIDPDQIEEELDKLIAKREAIIEELTANLNSAEDSLNRIETRVQSLKQ